MDEFEVSYSLENEQQFWDELQDIVSTQCGSYHQAIDNCLRSYIHFTTAFKTEYLSTPPAITHCSSRLLSSPIWRENTEYVRLQLVYSLLQEEERNSVHLISSLLLEGGREDESCFEVMIEEGCFGRLITWIVEERKRLVESSVEPHEYEESNDAGLHKLLLELVYEMSRVQRLSAADLGEIDDEFVMGLFRIIEELSDDANDPYHYPVIRVLLVLNEQYMVASTTTAPDGTQLAAPTNRVVKVLSIHGSTFQTFGENIILLLNRETETSLQLLILKLLYLLFTTTATHEYFYTNDLRVLLDVIIRNLLDLPNELVSLRHTYLRVLYPLLAYTQLSQAPHYKRDEIIKTLSILGGSSNFHFAPADETTLRLVERVAQVPWLRDDDISEGDVARHLLGISLSPSKSNSSMSVIDVATVMAEPGVQTPSRNTEESTENENGASKPANEDVTAAEKAQEKAREEVLEVVKLNGSMEQERQKRTPPRPPKPRKGSGMIVLPVGDTNGLVEVKKVAPAAPPRRRTKLKSSISNVTAPDA